MFSLSHSRCLHSALQNPRFIQQRALENRALFLQSGIIKPDDEAASNLREQELPPSLCFMSGTVQEDLEHLAKELPTATE